MAEITAAAKHEQRKAKRQRWIERHIVAPDPYDDGTTSDGIPLPLLFIMTLCGGAAFYLAGWAVIRFFL